jgi:23S rRNA (uridine2552-2'-O)-methyltransferase
MTYKRKDQFYEKAKSEGYRSRAAYKLQELDQKYHVLKPGKKVLDLGCWPGGWVQVAAKRVGQNGLVVGIDLTATDPLPFPQVTLLEGDVRDEESLEQARELAGGAYDVVLSDMSPKHTGIKEVDQPGTAHAVEMAFWVSSQLLKPGGSFVAKAFPSGDLDRFIPELKKAFAKFHRVGLKSTRKTSKEFYICCTGFKGNELYLA